MDSEKKRTPSLCSILKPSNSSNSTLLDNPCWGGRESNQQDLPYLLHLMDTKYFAMKTVTSKLNKQHDNELHKNEFKSCISDSVLVNKCSIEAMIYQHSSQQDFRLLIKCYEFQYIWGVRCV